MSHVNGDPGMLSDKYHADVPEANLMSKIPETHERLDRLG